MAYNGETAAHVQLTPEVTESSRASYTEPALSARDSESDSNATKELVRFVFHLHCFTCVCD